MIKLNQVENLEKYYNKLIGGSTFLKLSILMIKMYLLLYQSAKMQKFMT